MRGSRFFTAAGDKIRDKILSYLIAAGDTHFTRTELVSFSRLAYLTFFLHSPLMDKPRALLK